MATEETVTHIRNIVWARPISVNGNTQKVKLSLYPEKSYVSFEAHTENDEEGTVIHSQGKLFMGTTEMPELINIDIEQIRGRCKTTILAKKCYEQFAGNGLNYGPAFQGIRELYVGKHEALGLIELPKGVANQKETFYLHPSIMDAALQTTIGLSSIENNQTYLPFALKELNINRKPPTKVFAYARLSKGVDPNGNILKYDIDITDETGEVCVSFKEFTTRLFNPEEKKGESSILFAAPQWYGNEVERENGKIKGEIKGGKIFLLGVDKDREKGLKKELCGIKV